MLFFLFKQKSAYEMRISDWSSDVCSSDLPQMFLTLKEAPWPFCDASSRSRSATRASSELSVPVTWSTTRTRSSRAASGGSRPSTPTRSEARRVGMCGQVRVDVGGSRVSNQYNESSTTANPKQPKDQ